MNEESPTSFLERKHPVVKAVVDYALKRLELFVVLTLAGSGITFYEHRDAKNQAQSVKQDTSYLGTNWVGHDLMDAHNEIYSNHDAMLSMSNKLQQQINQLKERK